MNCVQLIGNVASKHTSDAVTTIRVAVDRISDGTDFITVKCFGGIAKVVNEYVDKGKRVGISGRLSSGSYEKDGATVHTLDVIAINLDLL